MQTAAILAAVCEFVGGFAVWVCCVCYKLVLMEQRLARKPLFQIVFILSTFFIQVPTSSYKYRLLLVNKIFVVFVLCLWITSLVPKSLEPFENAIESRLARAAPKGRQAPH